MKYKEYCFLTIRKKFQKLSVNIISPNKIKFSSFFLFFLVFGVALEGYSQITRGCLTECRPQGQGNITATDFILEDEEGNIIDVDNCDNIQGPIFVSFEYRSNNLNNVFFKSNLIITSNIDNSVVANVEFDYLIGDLPGTQGTNTRRHRFQVTLPPTYNCQSHSLQLTDIEIRWTQPNRAAICGNYNGGSCRNNFGNRDVSVGGFFYSFDYEIGCFEEDGSVAVNFVLRNLAGGQRPYNITWTIDNNGETDIILDRNIVAVRLQSPSDNLTADLLVTYSGGQTMNPRPEPISPDIPDIFVAPETAFTDNDENISPFPNGSISIDMGSRDIANFEFVWTDDFGNLIDPPDPTNPTFLEGLEGGIYGLVIRDLETGLCRVFEFPLNFIRLPVIFREMLLDFNTSERAVNFSWSTTKEWEASHFEVERSVGELNFKKIGEVKAAGWSDNLTEYVFEDRMLPLTAGNFLYRLKQVDLYGDYDYSKALSIRVPGLEFTSGTWRVFPNPTDGNALRINLLDAGQYNNEPLTFRLIHPTAQTQTISVASEVEMNNILAQMIGRIPRGVFVVEIQWGQKIEYLKILKQ